MKTIEVVAAVIRDGNNIFATQHGHGEFKDGWKFPGGKIEAGESPKEALKREIQEELDTKIEVGALIDVVEYDYPTFHIKMHCFWCIVKEGSLTLKEHEAAKWVSIDEIDKVEWLPADRNIIGKIQGLKIKDVNEFFKWRKNHSKKNTVEAVNKKKFPVILNKWKWTHTDVMYSFLGIYALGVWVYHKDKIEFNDRFSITNCFIKVKQGSKKQDIYSEKFLEKLQLENNNADKIELAKDEELKFDVKALNSYMEISILPKYFDVGNVIPIWPGGNENKGETKGCFDIPELYFAKYYDWFKALRKIYKSNICLEGVIDENTLKRKKYRDMNSFLKSIDSVEKYKKFVDKVCSNIDTRTKSILSL